MNLQLPYRVLLLMAPLIAGCGAPPADDARENWFAVVLRGARVGYAHTVSRTVMDDGQEFAEILSELRMEGVRDGETISYSVNVTARLTPGGRLVSCRTTTDHGAERTVAAGRVDGGKLVVTLSQAGRTITRNHDWPVGGLGFDAMDRSLWEQPMQSGETREFVGLEPYALQPVRQRFTARGREWTSLLNGSAELTVVDHTRTLPDGTKLSEIVWMNGSGEVVKVRDLSMGIEWFLTTEVEAKRKNGVATADFRLEPTIPYAGPPPATSPRALARFRVRFAKGNPAELFPTNRRQVVVPIDEHTADILINPPLVEADGQPPHVVARGGGKIVIPIADSPTDEDRQPNLMIQSDDPRVVELANKPETRSLAGFELAAAFEERIGRTIETTSFQHGFATAADAARMREGDCSECAVLLAAVARARGIPARTTVGLLYVEADKAFGYHMWTEMWIDGRWLEFDATRPAGGVGPTHLKLAHTNLAAGITDTALFRVGQLVGAEPKIEAADD